MKRYLFFFIVLLSFCFNWNRVEAKSKTSREEKGCTGLDHNRFRYYDSNSGTYISKDPIGLAGNNPNLYAYVYDSNTEVDSSGLYGVKRNTPAWKARGWQGSGAYPGTDTWRTVTLEKGTIVYGGIPGQSEFYLSKESLEMSGKIKETLWESAQVKPHDKFGYRSQVQAYVLTEDIKVAVSTRSQPSTW